MILADFCFSYIENILLEISGKRARCNCGFFMLILTKLNDCPTCPNSLMEKRLGFDFGVGLMGFLPWLVIRKLFSSCFS